MQHDGVSACPPNDLVKLSVLGVHESSAAYGDLCPRIRVLFPKSGEEMPGVVCREEILSENIVAESEGDFR
jgi:hypothetical protein